MSTVRRWVIMSVLSLSGGIIFLMPFLQEIYFIPLSDALDLNNTEVGSLMSAFGVTAMLSYFPGGWLADRISPRKLITISLLTTGAAGLYFATFPSYKISLAIHALWGVTVTFLFFSILNNVVCFNILGVTKLLNLYQLIGVLSILISALFMFPNTPPESQLFLTSGVKNFK